MSDAEPTLKDVLDAVHEVSRTVHRHTAIRGLLRSARFRQTKA